MILPCDANPGRMEFSAKEKINIDIGAFAHRMIDLRGA
jgi:hypothetical protein